MNSTLKLALFSATIMYTVNTLAQPSARRANIIKAAKVVRRLPAALAEDRRPPAPLPANGIEFDTLLAQENNDFEQAFARIMQLDKVVVAYYGPGCSLCTAVGKAIHEVINSTQNSDIIFVRIHEPKHPNFVAQQGIKEIPTLRFYKNGVLKSALVKPRSAAVINKEIDKLRP